MTTDRKSERNRDGEIFGIYWDQLVENQFWFK